MSALEREKVGSRLLQGSSSGALINQNGCDWSVEDHVDVITGGGGMTCIRTYARKQSLLSGERDDSQDW